jgi:hypothetical protein
VWIFPLVAAVVALVFSVELGRGFLAGRRPSHAAWAIALVMYSGASVALMLGVLGGWTTAEYRAFWLLGAVLNVPYLALGEGFLLVRRRLVVDGALVVVVFATAFALHRVRTAQIDPAALVADLPRGSEVFAPDPFVLTLARAYSYTAYGLLVAGTLWSAWRMRAMAERRHRFAGTLAIALGATVVAGGSAFAAAGSLPGFAITIAVGVSVMFWGFVRASRPLGGPAPTPEPAPAPAAEISREE